MDDAENLVLTIRIPLRNSLRRGPSAKYLSLDWYTQLGSSISASKNSCTLDIKSMTSIRKPDTPRCIKTASSHELLLERQGSSSSNPAAQARRGRGSTLQFIRCRLMQNFVSLKFRPSYWAVGVCHWWALASSRYTSHASCWCWKSVIQGTTGAKKELKKNTV